MEPVNREQIANQLINRVRDFPSQPAFISKIIQLNADPESSLEEISRVVEAEISLATAVIKLANSPLFGLSRHVSSISHAISVLGSNELLNLVLTHAMFQTYKGIKEKKHHISVLRFHSFKCALVARFLADKIGNKSGDFFIAGLVHDIGKIIIYLAFSENILENIYHGSPLEHDDIRDEEDRLGIGHTTLGRSLLGFWMFPDSLQAAVEFHHQPEKAGEHSVFPLVIYAADTLVRILDVGRNRWQEQVSLRQKLLAGPAAGLLAEIGLSITAENLDILLADVEKIIDQEGDLAKMFA